MPDGLVAAPQDETEWYSGISQAEDIASLSQSIENGDWLEAGITAAPLLQDAVSLVTDPMAALDILITAGLGWIIEHVQPLKQALDDLAGDPPVIKSYGQTWQNVATRLNEVATQHATDVRVDLTGWTGPAATRYSAAATERCKAMTAAAKASAAIGNGVQQAGFAVEQVRVLVRDTITSLVSAIIQAVLPPGPGTARAVGLIAKAGSKIARLIGKLTRSLAKLGQLMRKLASSLQGLLRGLRGRARGGTHAPARSPHIGDTRPPNSPDGGGSTTPSGATTPSNAPPADAPPSPRGADSSSPPGTTPDSPGSVPSPPRTRGDGGSTPSSSRPREPNATSTPVRERNTTGDPIDVVSGELVQVQTDVQLPGVLPLVLRRVHSSAYRHGRGFGTSWASTVDQRLAFDAKGVTFLTEDGMRLVYPEPAQTGSVLPQVGPRFPLRRNGSGFAVDIAGEGRTLLFGTIVDDESPLIAITDRNGNRIDIDRDDTGMVTAVRHSGGYHIEVASTRGRITAFRLRGVAELVRFGYDDRGRLTEVVNSSGLPMRFGYDDAERMTGWQDRNGEWFQFGYDDAGRCVGNLGKDGYLTGSFSYDDDNRTTRYFDALGNVTTYEYNERNKVVAQTDPLGNTTRTTWDVHGRVLSRTDPLGRTVEYTYDGDRLLAVTNSDGTQTNIEYNELGQATSIAEADGAFWRREYDTRGNLITLIDPVGATTRFTYTATGGLASSTDPLGHTRTFETNAAGLPIAVTAGLDGVIRFQRDPFGRISTIIDPVGGIQRMSWTVEGALLSRTLPGGATERWTYDGEGNVVTHTNAVGQVTRTEYGAFDLPVARTRPDGTRMEFGYDPLLRLISVTNPQGRVWHYEYDAVDNLVAETDFNGRTLRYAHDSAGQLVRRTNGVGETVAFVRDVRGNVTEKHAGDLVTSYAYDVAGRLVRARSSEVELRLDYDERGLPLAETVNGRTLRNSYDALGRQLFRRTPTGAESVWRYDTNGHPVELSTAGHTLRFGYDQAGREVRRQWDAGADITTTWTPDHRLATQTVTASGPPEQAGQTRLVQRRAYRYRPDGKVTGIDDHLSGFRRFDLDHVGRVIAAHGPQWTESYAYDRAGNITNAAWSAAADDAADTQGPREYSGTLIRRAGNTHYQHDQQGRVLTKTRRTLSGQVRRWTYQWDAEDQLIGVITPDGTRWRYLYDPIGRRVAKQRMDDAGRPVEETHFTWDGVLLVEQVTEGTAMIWDYEPGTFRPLSQAERVPGEDSQEWFDRQFYALITDLVGTPTEMVSPDGDLAWHNNSTTLWGQALSTRVVSPSCPLRFPGQYHDPETGDNYNYYRYYDPIAGRYSANDPLGLIPGPNPHVYVPNPTTTFDPLGLSPYEGASRQQVRMWVPKRPGVDDSDQDPLPESLLIRHGDNLQQGHYNYVVMPDGSVRALHVESIDAAGVNAGHYSLGQGKPVIMAGTFDVEDGNIVRFDRFSGHYRPGGPGTPESEQPAGPGLEAIARDALGKHGFDLGRARWSNDSLF